jgi:putative solute:sodium symporter small subunit
MSERTSSGAPAPRVRVTAPTAGRPRRTTVAREIDAQSAVGEVYMRSLVRSQLRLALGLFAVLVLTVGALPLLFVLVPWLQHGRVLGVPLAWVLLGAGCYPVIIGLAVVYVRRAERNERAFQDLVGPR